MKGKAILPATLRVERVSLRSRSTYSPVPPLTAPAER